MNCPHCVDLRARLQPAGAGYCSGALLIDGPSENPGNHQRLNFPSDEVMACGCPCHETWKRWVVNPVGSNAAQL